MSKGRTKRKLAKAIKFAALRAEGRTQLEAWRAIYPEWRNQSQAAQYVSASEFAADPLVASKCAETLQSANLNAMMSAPRYAAWLADLVGDAQSEKNHTAVMAGARLIGSTLGHLRDNLTVDAKNIPLDKHLADLRAAGVPEAAARRMLGMVDVTNALPSDAATNVTPIKSKA